ncbi:MAG: urease accessory protein UreE [Rhodospirillales bacterium]|nr:urease accessory protein UreE [Rhodospirillales bacterium]
MERVTEIAAAGTWPPEAERDCITLAHHDRHRRRLAMTATGGTEFLLDLPATATLHHGDGLKLSGGAYVRVVAAPEDLLEVTAASPAALARLAWHLGNRHLAAQIGGGRILIRADHVIAEMLQGLGAGVRPISAPFDPESGAYDSAATHHDHDHHHHGS